MWKKIGIAVAVVALINAVVNLPEEKTELATTNVASGQSAPTTPSTSAVDDTPTIAAQPVSPSAALRNKIDDDIFKPYSPVEFAKTHKQYGKRMPDVERARQTAAFLAASTSQCDRVLRSEVSTQSTVKNISIFVDCYNDHRARYNEAQLKDGEGQFLTANALAPDSVVRTGPAEIDKDVFEPYTRDQYPKAFAKYGKRMADLERARQAAAYLASASPACDRVLRAEISLMNSSVKELEAFADCDNEKRFRYREPELKDAKGRFYTAKTTPGR